MRNMFGRPILSAIAAAVSLLAMQVQAQSVSQSAAEGGRFWFVELAGRARGRRRRAGVGARREARLPARGRRRRRALQRAARLSHAVQRFLDRGRCEEPPEAAPPEGREGDLPGRDDHPSGGRRRRDGAEPRGRGGIDRRRHRPEPVRPERSRRHGRHHRHRHRHRPSGLRRLRHAGHDDLSRTPASSPATTSSATPTTRAAPAMRSFRTRTTTPTIAPATAPTCRASSAPTAAA